MTDDTPDVISVTRSVSEPKKDLEGTGKLGTCRGFFFFFFNLTDLRRWRGSSIVVGSLSCHVCAKPRVLQVTYTSGFRVGMIRNLVTVHVYSYYNFLQLVI